ncbi:hypothetical protein KUTeg_011533 [Tegillarca granosa]|uniref:Uncharacterized protein n=1 Tax=Tegillarca granosa TaxID=220873 RepID=A0ABQ9EWW1_TEGGR|nr:hypothetical protein KUTeg_011533 [Tegillarca granosa]
MDSSTNTKYSMKGKIALLVGIVTCFIIATVVGLSLHFLKKAPPGVIPKTVQYGVIIGCGKDDVDEEHCITIGCVWIDWAEHKAPKCVYKEDTGYTVIGDIQHNGNTYTASLRRKGLSKVFDQDVHEMMKVEVEMYNDYALRIHFYPRNSTDVFEIPDEALKMNKPTKATDSRYKYHVTFTTEPYFGIQVIRNSTGAVIFNTTLPGLLFAEQFIQISTKLPSDNIYGFGEHNHRRFRHDMNWKLWPIFTRDVAPIDEWNLYGAHPVYMNLENDGNANMVFLKNSNAMDILLQPNPYPAITYRTIGGVLDFYIFLGPTPQMALQQYTEAVGRPLMPPYWSLGFQLCKWGYENLSVVEDVVERTKEADFPQDVQWGDIDYMYNKFIFTRNNDTFYGLPEFVDKLHDEGQKYVIIIDPGVGSNDTIYKEAKRINPGYKMYEDGVANNTFITINGSILQGEVWPGQSAFPDFTNLENTLPWWEHYIRYFYYTSGVKFDGLWIDMNEPASFVKGSSVGCAKNKWNYPPYVPHILGGDYDGGSLFDKTICMDAQQKWGKHYDVHSLYGHSMAIVTNKALQNVFPQKRPFVLTRSSFAGTGKYAATWLGDNQSQWRQIPWSIIGWCRHLWILFRSEPQDPAAWGTKFVGIVRQSILIRYKILPYLYTLYHEAHVYGNTVGRSLMFEYPQDKNTWDIDRQFLLGAAFLVTPVMEKGTEVQNTGTTHTLDAPLEIINLHLRGGYILPTQEPDNTTVYSRKRPLGLMVCLDENKNANGNLFWDDGESKDTYTRRNYLQITFNATQGQELSLNVVHSNYAEAKSLYFGIIEIYGLNSLPGELYVTKYAHSTERKGTYVSQRKRLFVFINGNDRSIKMTRTSKRQKHHNDTYKQITEKSKRHTKAKEGNIKKTYKQMTEASKRHVQDNNRTIEAACTRK